LKEKSDDLFKSRDERGQKVFEKLTERFLILLKNIWRKVRKMVKGEEISEGDKKIIKKYSWTIITKIKQESEKYEEDSASFGIFLLISAIILSIVNLAISFFLTKEVMFYILIFGIFPLSVSLVGEYALFHYGKTAIYRKRLILISAIFLFIILFLPTLLNLMKPFKTTLPMNEIIGIMFILLIFYVLTKPLMRSIFGINKIGISERNFLTYKSGQDTKTIYYKIINLLSTIEELSITMTYEDTNRYIYNIGNNYYLFIILKGRHLLMTVFRESGIRTFQDDTSREIQEGIDFICREILHFKLLEEKKIEEELKNEYLDLFINKYSSKSYSVEKLSNLTKIPIMKWVMFLSVMIVGGIIIVFIQNQSLQNYIINIVIFLFLYSILFMRPKKEKRT